MRPPLPANLPPEWVQPIRRTSVEPTTRFGIPISAWPFLLFVPAWTWLALDHRYLAAFVAVAGFLVFRFLTHVEPFWISLISQLVVTRFARFAVAPRWLWKRCSYMAPR